VKPFDVRTAALQPGTTLLEASAGTGKTHAITALVLRLLLEGKVESLPQILVVTFTVAASEELKNRLRAGLQQTLRACLGEDVSDAPFAALGRQHGRAGAERLRQALAMADEMSVSTIHGFCRRVLETAAFAGRQPFAAEFVEDEIPLLLLAARDAVRSVVFAGDAVIAAVADFAGVNPDALVADYRAWQRHPDTRLRPEPPPLPPAMTALRHALGNARAHHNAQPPDRLGALPIKKQESRPLLDLGAQLPEVLRTRLLDPDDPCLHLLALLGRTRLRAECLRGKAGDWLEHPFYGDCDLVAATAATAATALRGELLRAMHSRLQREKAQGPQLLFQDLLTQVVVALRDPERRAAMLATVGERWQVALIDEFQDTDRLQYEIFATCFGKRLLLLVGDPKQSIYRFRGADVHSYLQAREDATRRHTLGENHRSHPLLVAAVDRLFGGPLAFALPGIALPTVTPAIPAEALAIRGDDGPPLQIRWLEPMPGPGGKPSAWRREDLEERIARDVGDECVRLLGSGVRLAGRGGERALAANDIAVLTRTNAQAVRMQRELRERRVHSAIGRAGDVFRCPEMAEMQRVLAALANPLYLPTLRAAWTTVLWGMAPAGLRALEDDDDRLQLELAFADRMRRTWLRHGFIVMFEALLTELDCRARLLQRRDGERRLTNCMQIAELLHRAELDRRLAPESLLLWLQQERAHADDIDYQLRELRLESDADAVQILTVHGCKGLQYEIVFAPFLGQSREEKGNLLVPDDRGGTDYVEAAHVTPADEVHAVRERIAEDVRLCYVALTRARRRCYLHWAETGKQGSALAWLLHGPGRRDRPAATYDPDWRDAVRARAAEWLHDLETLAAGSGGAIAWTRVPAAAPAVRSELAGDAAAATARSRPLPRKPDGWRIASFTSMLAAGRGAELERDHAEPAAPARTSADPATPSEAPPLRGVHAFARGTAAGICLHAILERLDFARAGAADATELVAQQLRRHGLAAAAAHPAPLSPVDDVCRALQRLCAAPLPGLGFALAELPPRARSVEWQFFLASASRSAGGLAAAFADTGDPDYAARLRQLPAAHVRGFLRGFVDLLCEHRGRYWVFDWKSNWLGPDENAYEPAKLRADLVQHDYVLQYHLYLLALHLHLRARLPGYDYERHVGGACYVYLRGVDHPQRGVIVDRPPLARIEALVRWLGGAA
jgi:exodeoxyribonuclease V beta subunit